MLYKRRNLTAINGVVTGIFWSLMTFREILQARSNVNRFRKVKDADIFPKIMISGNIFSFYQRYFRLARMTEALMK